ncbi:prospero homeobox protein 1-like isoform X2 [Ambystoma mexicanum]|uniref:prospero homeobox protein 1-like isoform X2 n=1 Tax=Ambystoma mexicanum TaxID=8296 RepID=UPI0037E80149
MSLTAADLKVECVEEEEDLDGASFTYHFSVQSKDNPYRDPSHPFPDRNIISQLLRKGIVRTRHADTSEPGDPGDSGLTGPVPEALAHGSPMGSTFKRRLDSEGFYEDFMKAKRARVENIVCNISSSCSSGFRNGGSSEGEEPVGSSYEAHHREAQTQNTARGQERSELKHQMEKMREQLFQLQEKLYRMYAGVSGEDPGARVPKEGGGQKGSGACTTKSTNVVKEFHHCRYDAASKENVKAYQSTVKGRGFCMLDLESKSLAEALKEELSTAVTQVVDAVVQAFSRPGTEAVLPPVQVTSSHLLMEHRSSSEEAASHLPQRYFEALSSGTPSEGDVVSFEEDQTEALPLVVRKDANILSEPSSSNSQHVSSRDLDKGGLVSAPFPHVPQYSVPKIPHAVPLNQLHFKDRAPIEAFWDGVSLRTKLSARHMMQQQCPLFQLSGTAEAASCAHIPKLESRDPRGGVDTSLYRPSSSQEGLTPGHLKKAKLMFFYCRYPSSTTLKTYFNDVKIPAKFLEVSQITLREFFSAVVTGKDVDPSWKKAIYKVICKLDSDIPEAFKSPNCLLEPMNA